MANFHNYLVKNWINLFAIMYNLNVKCISCLIAFLHLRFTHKMHKLNIS